MSASCVSFARLALRTRGAALSRRAVAAASLAETEADVACVLRRSEREPDVLPSAVGAKEARLGAGRAAVEEVEPEAVAVAAADFGVRMAGLRRCGATALRCEAACVCVQRE